MELRDELLKQLNEDILGPGSPTETIQERPTDRYLTGILWPNRTSLSGAEDETLSLNNESPEADGDSEESVALRNVTKPSSAGLSCAVRCTGQAPKLEVVVSFAVYERATDQSGATIWIRKPVEVPLTPEVMNSGEKYCRRESGLPDQVEVHLVYRPWQDTVNVTATLINRRSTKKASTPDDIAVESLFQTKLEVRPLHDCELIARPSIASSSGDDDGAGATLIYRDAREFATGHMCSASWELTANGAVRRVFTEWVPNVVVPATSADGDKIFGRLSQDGGIDVLSAEWLSSASDAELIEGLRLVPELYIEWLDHEAQKVNQLPVEMQAQSARHLATCRIAAERMKGAIEYLNTEKSALNAFRFANEVMRLQRSWTDSEPLRWRPFQLGFVLLALESTGIRQHTDRSVMDLLWFPTGGGKTEAYLFLTVFAITIRRLTSEREGDGVAVLMRYTLRLLTIQQFQRAAAMVLACDLLRRNGKAKNEFWA